MLGERAAAARAFKLDASNNYALTTLVNFATTTTSPNEPRAAISAWTPLATSIAQRFEGGPTASTSYGTIFKLSAGSYTNSQVAYFTSTTGVHPYGGVASDAAGNLYGTTEALAGGQGSLSKLPPIAAPLQSW